MALSGSQLTRIGGAHGHHAYAGFTAKSVAEVTPTAPGLEYTLPTSRMHYTTPESRLHYTLEDEDS